MAAHRYWRLYITANNGDTQITQIAEIELRESIGGADATGSGTASADSFYASTWAPSKAFDNSSSTHWATSANQEAPTWIQYDFGAGQEKDIVEYTLRSTSNALTRMPMDWQLEWSDNDADWTAVDTRTGEIGWGSSETRIYAIGSASLITDVSAGVIAITPAGRPLSSVGGVVGWNIAAGSIGLTAQSPQSILAIPAGSIELTAQAPQSLITLKPPRAGFTPVYRLTITDPPSGLPDLVIQRIANFQARTRSGVNSYLTVTIPGVDLIDTINALINGEFYIEGWLRYADGSTTAAQEIARANIDRADPYEGANNQSIVLTGYKQTTYTLPKIVQVNQAITKVAQSGVNRWRIPPALTLRPLDTLDYQGAQIVAQQIVYTVGPRQGYMDVSDSTGF